MLIAHLPAGYLIGRALVKAPSRESAARLAAIMAGSVFPDVDLLYFYLFDHQRTHHHLCWTHVPAFWLAVCAGILLHGRRSGTFARRLRCGFFCSASCRTCCSIRSSATFTG